MVSTAAGNCLHLRRYSKVRNTVGRCGVGRWVCIVEHVFLVEEPPARHAWTAAIRVELKHGVTSLRIVPCGAVLWGGVVKALVEPQGRRGIGQQASRRRPDELVLQPRELGPVEGALGVRVGRPSRMHDVDAGVVVRAVEERHVKAGADSESIAVAQDEIEDSLLEFELDSPRGLLPVVALHTW
jgi:hypothetical protein